MSAVTQSSHAAVSNRYPSPTLVLSDQIGGQGRLVPNEERLARGVYVLADDKIACWVAALLSSLRRFNPDLPVILVPHEDEHPGLLEVAAAFSQVYVLSRDFERFDRIGRQILRGRGIARAPRYRKLAVFNGPFENFLFIDADCVVLSSLDALFEAHDRYDLVFNNFAAPGRNFAEESLGDLMSSVSGDPRAAAGYNSAFFGARRGVVPEGMFARLGRSADRLRGLLGTATDQALISYCACTLGLSTTRYEDAVEGWCSDFRVPQQLALRDGRFVRGNEQGAASLSVLHWGGDKNQSPMPGREILEAFYPFEDFDPGAFT
ncbi:MAG: hypothetical protein AAF416_00530 [Pseudomonadota bacterium]